VSARFHVDPDALLCALVLAPRTYSRNRFFSLYEDGTARRVRRRAARVRGVIRQLAVHGRGRAEVVGEQVLDDGRVLIRYRVPELSYHRTIALSALEAATVRFALHRAGQSSLSGEDRALVERALERLGGAEPPAEVAPQPGDAAPRGAE